MKTQITALPDSGYVRLPTILTVIPISKATWWKGVKSGKFPKAIKLGARISVWKTEDIKQLITALETQSGDDLVGP